MKRGRTTRPFKAKISKINVSTLMFHLPYCSKSKVVCLIQTFGPSVVLTLLGHRRFGKRRRKKETSSLHRKKNPNKSNPLGKKTRQERARETSLNKPERETSLHGGSETEDWEAGAVEHRWDSLGTGAGNHKRNTGTSQVTDKRQGNRKCSDSYKIKQEITPSR